MKLLEGEKVRQTATRANTWSFRPVTSTLWCTVYLTYFKKVDNYLEKSKCIFSFS